MDLTPHRHLSERSFLLYRRMASELKTKGKKINKAQQWACEGSWRVNNPLPGAPSDWTAAASHTNLRGWKELTCSHLLLISCGVIVV